MDKQYSPSDIEQRWYQQWEQQGYFQPSGQGEPYCIMLPPPNVTGTLHMGHGFQHSVMDCLIRMKRMAGHNTLWQAGTDHAGIATQMVVERLLNAEGKTRHDLGRDAFVERIWQWKDYSGGSICQQMRRLGDSADWSRERFTMDPDLSNAVQEVFIRLHEEGLIYRGLRLVNWDPVLQTAVSDLEVLSEEENGSLWHLRYPLAEGSGYLVVATTRPETLLGDSAVAVHPDDARYQHLIGQQVRLPIANRLIPIIADPYVDPAFGTGCVKITPAHDFNDYEVGKRHDLPLINVFTNDAKLNDQAPEAYRGLDRFDARKQLVAELQALELLEKVEPHKLKVPRGDRTNAVIEPFLTHQWFVKIAPLAEPAIKAVESGEIRFVPENWSKTYFQWMHNIQDWCISRQLWWGHRVPAWFDNQGNIYVGRNEAEIRAKHQLDASVELNQDTDVLDTWFSSALWPFATLGWPQNTAELKTFLPSQVLVTGFDIIFFWVARMIMMTLKFTGEIPFKEIYITGLIRDEHGQKMSKSKGNVLDPIDLIDGIELEPLVTKRTTGLMRPQDKPEIEAKTRAEFPNGIAAYGTDALRFTFLALASNNRDINFATSRVEANRNFCNKIWNAARFVLMNTEDQDCGQNGGELEFSASDRWIISLVQKTEADVLRYVEQYRFDLATQSLYELTWNQYCDWYLELAKATLWPDSVSPAAKRATRYTLVRVMETLMRLIHPFMPFITEEIWQRVAPLAGKTGASIMLQPYPISQADKIDPQAEADLEWLKAVTLAVRNIRGEMAISLGKQLPVYLVNGNAQEQERLSRMEALLKFMAKLSEVHWLNSEQNAPTSATALVGELQVMVPMAGLIDKDAELARLAKELDKAQIEYDRLAAKLANPGFTDKAPAAVVAKERDKLADTQQAIQQLQQQQQQIAAL